MPKAEDIEDQPGRFVVVREDDVAMRTRDGVTLYADVYRPAAAEPVPVLLRRTPYGKRDNDLAADFSEARYFASHGYLVVVQDTRGRFTSTCIPVSAYQLTLENYWYKSGVLELSWPLTYFVNMAEAIFAAADEQAIAELATLKVDPAKRFSPLKDEILRHLGTGCRCLRNRVHWTQGNGPESPHVGLGIALHRRLPRAHQR